MARLLDGRLLSNVILKEVVEEVAILKENCNINPMLGVVLVGNRKDSVMYLRSKRQAAISCGIQCQNIFFHEDANEEELLDKIDELNESPNIHGILVQLPLPSHLQEV